MHALLLGAGSFVAMMIAGLITTARGPLGKFENMYRDLVDWVSTDRKANEHRTF